jgi:hypothetical protein
MRTLAFIGEVFLCLSALSVDSQMFFWIAAKLLWTFFLARSFLAPSLGAGTVFSNRPVAV